jgi:hypothetical protein
MPPKKIIKTKAVLSDSEIKTCFKIRDQESSCTSAAKPLKKKQR